MIENLKIKSYNFTPSKNAWKSSKSYLSLYCNDICLLRNVHTTVEDNIVTLSQGDIIIFDKHVPHSVEATGENDLVLILF